MNGVESEGDELYRESRLQDLYSRLGITADDEIRAQSEQLPPDTPEAIRLGRQRSFENIRSSVRDFVSWCQKKGKNLDELIPDLEAKMAEARETMVMAYYEEFPDALRILQSGSLKNLFEFSDTEQSQRKKPSELGVSSALHKRRIVDTDLGWTEAERVYHMVAERAGDGHDPEGPASNYGSVRFVFDFDKLAGHSTFTEGDALNPDHLPVALASKYRTVSSSGWGMTGEVDYKVAQRQITKEHVPIAKTILSLATSLEQRPRDQAIFLRYIEAQVGGIGGLDMMKSLKGIEIDLDEAFNEGRLSRLFFNRERSDAIYEKYFGEKPGATSYLSRIAPDFSEEPSKRVDFENYDRELAELRFSEFLASIEKIRKFCEERNLAFQQKGNLEEIRELCLKLTKDRRF